MRVAVTTPTGKIGRVVADRLVQAGTETALLARGAEKVSALIDRGAKLEIGDLQDADFVREATRGADVLFWVTPPDMTQPDFRDYQNRVGRNGAAAVRANGIARVLNISSVGASLESGTGPIAGLHDVEGHFDEVAPNVTHLRPPAFMENFLASLGDIKESKSIFLPGSGDTIGNFASTRDIAEFAAGRILDASWTGQQVVELFGPQSLTYDAATAVISDALGETIRHVQVSPEDLRAALVGMGVSEDAARAFNELYEAAENGLLKPHGAPTPETTMKTTLAEFARDVIVPLVKGTQIV